MSIISEKVAYLRGLAEGMKISEDKDEGKLLLEIISVLGEIADDLDYLEDTQDELSDAVYDLEDEVYGELEDDEDEPLVVTCPHCDEEFFIDEEELLSGEPLECPSCGQEIELEFDCDCDCGCDCCDD